MKQVTPTSKQLKLTKFWRENWGFGRVKALVVGINSGYNNIASEFYKIKIYEKDKSPALESNFPLNSRFIQ